MLLADQNKFPIEFAKLQANAYFKQQLAKCDATRFTGNYWGNSYSKGIPITFGMLNEVERAMKETTKLALEDCLEDSKVKDDPAGMPDHVKRMTEANQTFAVTPLNSTNDKEPENLSDLDSMAIKFALDLFEKQKKKPMVHLQWLIVDISNKVAIGVAPIAS